MNIANDGGWEEGERLRPAQALETELVLVNIFSRLSPKDLKDCRLVCRGWHRLATPELQKKMGRLIVSDSGGIDRFSGSVDSRFKSIGSFITFCRTRAASESPLEKIQFTKICFNFYPDKNILSLDWTLQIKSLELLGLTPTQFNPWILPILQRMTQLTHLRLNMFKPGDIKIAGPPVTMPQDGARTDLVHGLEALEVVAHTDLLDLTDTAFLKICKKLEVLSFDIEGATGEWREAFMYPEHNTSGVRFVKLKWWSGSESGGMDEDEPGFESGWGEDFSSEEEIYAMIAELINSYHKLEDLQLEIRDLDRSRCWDTVQILPHIRISSIKKLTLEITVLIVMDDDIVANEVVDWFYFLRQPQFQALEDLQIGIKSWLDSKRYGCDYAKYKPHVLHVEGTYFLLPTIKNLAVKFCHDALWKDSHVVLTEMLRTAALRMPALESFHVDVTQEYQDDGYESVAENFETVIRIAGCFAKLKDLTIRFIDCCGVPEDALFGNWESNIGGLFALKELENLSMLIPYGTIQNEKIFKDGFAKISGLRKLKINKTGCTEDVWDEVNKLDLGQVSLQWLSRANEEKFKWEEMVRAPIPEA